MQGFKRETRFTSQSPADEIINKIEEAAKPLGFDVQKKNFKVSHTFATQYRLLVEQRQKIQWCFMTLINHYLQMRLANSKAGRKGNLNVATEVYDLHFCVFVMWYTFMSYSCIKVVIVNRYFKWHLLFTWLK